MKTHLAATAFVATAALGVQAPAGEMTYLTYGADYEYVDAAGVHAAVGQIYVGGEFDMGQIFVSGEAHLAQADIGPIDISLVQADVLLGYQIEPRFMLLLGMGGRYAEGMGMSDTSSDYSAGLEYGHDALSLGAYVRGNEAGNLRYVAYGGYEISGATTLALQVEHNGGSSGSTYWAILEHERGPLDLLVVANTFDFNDGFFSVGAKYEMNPRFRVTGQVSYLGGTGSAAGVYELGAGYQIADNVWLDGSYSRYQSGGDGYDQVFVGISFETGSRRLMRSRIEDWQDESSLFLSF